jgi:peptidoglycan/LPS O-acetylase OafA/YrhL
MRQHAAGRPEALPALTSLRFLAALAVALFHVPFVLPQSVGRTVLAEGALGVSFFFVLSGFILKHVHPGPGLDLPGFYRRRAARVLPLHWLTLAAWTLLFFGGWGNTLQEKVNSGVANLLGIHALFSGPVFTLGYNAVSWSISVELVFYALFPLLLPRGRALAVLAALVAAFLALTPGAARAIEAAFPNFFYFHPLPRLLEFTAGMALHGVWRRWRPGFVPAGLAQAASLLALPLAVGASAGLPPHLRNLALLLPFAGVILAFAWDGALSRPLAWPGAVLLGEASFALYLTHHMLFRWLDPHLAGLAQGSAALALALAAAVALSLLVHLAFERPVRRRLLAVPAAVPSAPPRRAGAAPEAARRA